MIINLDIVPENEQWSDLLRFSRSGFIELKMVTPDL